MSWKVQNEDLSDTWNDSCWVTNDDPGHRQIINAEPGLTPEQARVIAAALNVADHKAAHAAEAGPVPAEEGEDMIG